MICENCGKDHDGKYGSGRFCSKECAKGFSGKRCNNICVIKSCVQCGKPVQVNCHFPNKHVLCNKCKLLKIHNKYESLRFKKSNNTHIQSKHVYKKMCNIKLKSYCRFTNNISCEKCVFKQICNGKNSIAQKMNTLLKYFSNQIDSNKLFDYQYMSEKYIELKQYVQELIDSGLSSNEVCKLLFGSYKKGNTVFNILQCKTRNLSESISNAILQGKIKISNDINNYRFKEEWHNTWDGKTVFLRSSYETTYANKLDSNKILYEVETLKIKYYDSQRKIYRCAIPDFYLPESNEIIEIKSSFTYDEQNMKDKFKAYRELGYNCKCICDWIELDI